MKLTDFTKKPVENAQIALKEHFDTKIDVTKFSYPQVRNMLHKVRGLISESKSSATFYESQNSPAYLKLIFMEQALSDYFNQLVSKRPTIVTENEEVEKSQVVLAAQDMVNEVRKMIETVSDMLVKELPALVDSMQSEMGVNEANSFNTEVTTALQDMQSSLTQGETTLKNALNTVTGQGGGIADMDMGADMDSVEPEAMPVDGEEEIETSTDIQGFEPEEPEEPEGNAGREKR